MASRRIIKAGPNIYTNNDIKQQTQKMDMKLTLLHNITNLELK